MNPAPKALLPIVLLLLAAAGAVFWLGYGAAAEPSPLRPDRDPDLAPAIAAPAPALAQGVVAADGTAVDDELPDLEALRDEVPVAAAIAAAAPRVLVVDGEPAQPVADAEVLFVTVPEATERRGDELPRRRLEWPEFCGDRVLTGQDGVAVLRPTRRTFLVAARSAGRFAFGVARPGNQTTTLTLRADETVAILVRDEQDRPVPAMPVALLQHRGSNPERGGDTIWRGETGPDGRAAAMHFQFLRERQWRGQPERFAAAVQLAAPAPVLVEFDGRPAPTDPVEIVVPPCGAVELLLADHRGEPLLAPARVTFRGADREAPTQGFPGADHLATSGLDKPVGPLPVVLDRLAADVLLRPIVRFETERRAAIGEPLAVPAADRDGGEGPDGGDGGDGRATAPLPVTMKLPDRFGVLAGRLVRADGAPLADQELTAVLWDGDRTVGTIRLHTTATGHFDAVQSPREQDALTLEFHLRVATGPPPPAGGRAPTAFVGARLDFRPPGGKERRELGEIVLDRLPALCRGVVVDDRGEPVRRATVRAQQRRENAERSPQLAAMRAQLGSLPVAFREQRVQSLRQNSRGGGWRNVAFLRARTADDGTFELFGTFPTGGELRLQADTDRHLADAVAWNGPGQTVRITIARNGFLRGRALLPAGLPRECATLTLQPIEPELRRSRTRRVELSRRRGGRFEVEPLHAGRYDAIVTLRSVAQPVFSVPDVFITPGECRDPRLQLIDLRQSVFRFRLQAVDPRGNRLRLDSPLLLRWRDPEGKTQNSGFRWRRGRADFFASSSIVDLVSFAPGCKPLEIQLAAGDHNVVMQPLMPAQVLVPGARQLCGPDRKIRVSVILSGDSGYPQSLRGRDQRTGSRFSFPRWELGKSTGAWLQASDLVEVPIVKSGKYRIVLRVHATQSTKSRQVSVDLGEYELDVDGTRTAPVTVPLDPEKLQATLARLPQAGQPRSR